MKQVLEAEARALIEGELKNFRTNASKYIQNATLSLLGLERSGYGTSSTEFEIDHCNGRNSVMIDAFRALAKSEAEKLARSYKPTKEDVLGFQEAFKKEYENQLRYAIRQAAEQKAKQDIKQYLDAHQINVSAIVDELINK